MTMTTKKGSVFSSRWLLHVGLVAICALLQSLAARTANALDEATQTQVLYQTSANTCFWGKASLRANGCGPGEAGCGNTLSMYGHAYEANRCSPGTYNTISNASGNIAIRYTLWKWNGTSAQVCRDVTRWTYNNADNYAYLNSRAGLWISDYGCRDGWYNLGVTAYIYKNGTWQGNTVFTDWLWADVNDNPPILQ